MADDATPKGDEIAAAFEIVLAVLDLIEAFRRAGLSAPQEFVFAGTEADKLEELMRRGYDTMQRADPEDIRREFMLAGIKLRNENDGR